MVAVRIERLKIGFAVDWTLSGEGRSTFELVSRLGLGASVARGGAYDLKTRLTAGRNRWPEPLAGTAGRSGQAPRQAVTFGQRANKLPGLGRKTFCGDAQVVWV